MDWFIVLKRHFQQYFRYIVGVSVIGGGNRRTRRKPPTCRKSLTNYYNGSNVVLQLLKIRVFVIIRV